MIVIGVLISLGAFAQEMLTLEQAVQVALKNNFLIQIAKNQSDIAANDVTPGNAGMLPQVSLNASGSFADNTINQQFLSGLEVNRSSVNSKYLNAGVALSWTLFDGMKMFVTYDKLKELRIMGELNLKVQIENNIADIISAYYEVVRQKQLIRTASQVISLYEEKERISETKYRIGAGMKLEVMQARVDKNAERSQLLALQNELFKAKASLNQLLGRNSETDFETADSISITYDPGYEDLRSTAEKKNNVLLFAGKNIKVSDYLLKEIRAERSPKIGLNSSYNFARSEYQAGFVLLNQNLGLNVGFFATWNLFNGFEVNRQLKDMQIQNMISKLQYEQGKTQLQNRVAAAYRHFVFAKDVLNLEQENSKIAKENVDISLEMFRIGKISSLELKDIQQAFEDTQTRLINAQYQAKLAETELMRLNGMLVK